MKDQLERSLHDFRRLRAEGELPPKMQAKLDYLQRSFTQGNESQPPEELPEFEKISLRMMNRETKISLFSSIVRCLAGREVVRYCSAEPAKLCREDGSGSRSCFLTCDSNCVFLTHGKDGSEVLRQFEVEELMVAKIYQQEGRRFSFGISYQGAKYRFRFQQEAECARVHAAVLSAIRERRNLKLQKASRVQQEDEDNRVQQRMLEEEREYLSSLLDRIEVSGLNSGEKFQLVSNGLGCKVMKSRELGAVRVFMLAEGCEVQALIESYVQFQGWNVRVEQFRVVNRIRRNAYLCHVRLKKFGLFSGHREGYFSVSYFKSCPCLKKNRSSSIIQNRDTQTSQSSLAKHYLLLTSISAMPVEGVRMNIDQIIQFSKQEGKTVFVRLLSRIDFNLYEWTTTNQELNLEWAEELPSIVTAAREWQVSTDRRRLFELDLCVCQRKKNHEQLSASRIGMDSATRKDSVASNISQISSISMQSSIQVQDFDVNGPEVAEVIAAHNKLSKVERIIDIITKKQYERYYLKERFFSGQPELKINCLTLQRKNFLALGEKWKLAKSNEYIFIDEDELRMQKGVLKLLVKQITANLMAGRSIMTMSLPVEIFDVYSALEGFARIFGFMPRFMREAVGCTDVTEQIKYVSMAFMFMFACEPKVSKPFNPLLGETYQGIIGGIPICFEQISHHPPISAFLIKTEDFEAYGNIDVLVDLGLNSAYTKIPSLFHVKIYATGTEYAIRVPDVELNGVMFGDRAMKTAGRGFALEKKSCTYLEYSIGKERKRLYEYKEKVRAADLVGGIFRITPSAGERLLKCDYRKGCDGIKPEEALQRLSLLSGKWFGDIAFDGVWLKTADNGPFPLELERVSPLLPSDCTFRLDVVYRRWRDYRRANQEKEILQNIQRRDRKLRERYSK